MIFVDEPHELIDPLGVKGLGEIGIVGESAAIANAIYHATGKRCAIFRLRSTNLLAGRARMPGLRCLLWVISGHHSLGTYVQHSRLA